MPPRLVLLIWTKALRLGTFSERFAPVKSKGTSFPLGMAASPAGAVDEMDDNYKSAKPFNLTPNSPR